MYHSAKALCMWLAIACLGLGAGVAAQGLCPDNFCDQPIESACDAGGFLITLSDFSPAPPSPGGIASYTYQVCSPAAGVCTGDGTTACLDNSRCTLGGNPPGGICTRDCAVDSFRDLSHFDIGLAGLDVCLAPGAQIWGSCTGGRFEIGPDGACGGVFVAKCDGTNLDPGQCLEMTINIPGEENAPGLGAAFSISKAGQPCHGSCFAGPSCEPCDGDMNGDECLTRTRGFWGTHPHLIQSDDPRSLDLLPITVCGDVVASTAADECSTSEALCTNAKDRKSNPTYLSLAAQLTAAKLNLAATAAVTDGGTCASWMFDGMDIVEWIDYCEANFCTANKKAISGSGCIEALDDFNNSQDTGLVQTPFPFDRPGPAMVSECQKARGNGFWVGNGNCM